MRPRCDAFEPHYARAFFGGMSYSFSEPNRPCMKIRAGPPTREEYIAIVSDRMYATGATNELIQHLTNAIGEYEGSVSLPLHDD